jgi:carbonic anhydrase
MIRAREALERLRQGNARFVSGARHHDPFTNEARRAEPASGQQPFAIVLGCSDSRVPAEIVFDQGLGDLLVVGAEDSLESGVVEFFDGVPGGGNP